ncbi:eukaryotic initiation factor 4A-13-like isoform X2 [Coffea arabica]|uniref:ATP-dependent RNA helicase n=1 Tax=Coffea arabica TaxID=13443 RepID=A0ABM4UZY5_COFAR
MEQSRYLPEGIIHRILRFLGATDQARVCVLSKDWLHAWQTYPAPTFSDQPLRCLFQQALGRGDEECEKYCRQGRLKFQDHVKRTLLNYKGEHIQELTLDIYHIGDEDSAATLDKLLEIAMEKGMAGIAPVGSQLDARECDAKMTELPNADGEDFLTSNDEVYDSFESMGLQENLLRGIYAYGVEKPSPVQQRGLVPFCKGLDVIQQAQSGSGKTATLCLGILQQLDYNAVDCQALVLVPSPELARKTERVMHSLGNYLGVKVCACEGCDRVPEDQGNFSHGVHVVVGSPDCVFDMLRRQSLRPDYVKTVVLNQADEMISRGFKNKIYDIFQLLAPKIQVGVFLATMPPEALEITRKLMNKPVRILVKLGEFTPEREEMKLETLSGLSQTDEAAMCWLDKRCRLWKPKNIITKGKLVNKKILD